MILIFFLLRVYFVLSEFNLRVRKAPSAKPPNRGGVTSDGGIIGL